MSNDPASYDGEISLKGILVFSLGLIVVIVLSFLLVWQIGAGLERRKIASEPTPPPFAKERAEHLPPAPNLQDHPEADWLAMRAEEELSLNSYRLLDSEKGSVQLPIEEAMRRVIEDGPPDFGDEGTP